MHGVRNLHFGDDCHHYHRRRLLSSSFVIIFIVMIIIIICHHRPFCGSWKLDHVIIFESKPLAAVCVSELFQVKTSGLYVSVAIILGSRPPNGSFVSQQCSDQKLQNSLLAEFSCSTIFGSRPTVGL